MQKIKLTVIGVIMILMLVACGDSHEDKGGSELATNSEGFKSTEETYNSTEALTEELNATTEMTQEPTEEETAESPETESETELSTEPVTESETFVGEVDPEYANLKGSEGFLFTSNGDGTCTLVEVGNCEDKKIVIPAISPQGDKVTKIGEGAFYYADDAKEVIFAGVSMELDKNAFSSCDLEKVVITGCDLIVAENVFSYCDKIEAIYISNSQIELNEYALGENSRFVLIDEPFIGKGCYSFGTTEIYYTVSDLRKQMSPKRRRYKSWNNMKELFDLLNAIFDEDEKQVQQSDSFTNGEAVK